MTDDARWTDIKRSLPVGKEVTGRVARTMPFGLVIDLDGHPGVLAVVDAASFLSGGAVAPQSDWPGVGSALGARVIDHSEHNRQVKLRVE